MPLFVRSRVDGSATHVDNEYKHTSTHHNGVVCYLVAASLVVDNDTTDDCR